MKLFNKYKLSDNTKKMNKVDWVIIGILVLLYGILSFIRLGDTKVPSTYKIFNNESEEVVIELKDVSAINYMRYYTGNNLGNIAVYSSEDGKEYKYLANIEINSVFTWQDLNLSTYAKYIKFTGANAGSTLGDVVFYRNGPTEVPMIIEKGNPLTDEIDLVPDNINFMNSTYFDEIYYARSAYEYVHGINVYEWTHPPLGKLLMTIPIYLFGFSPFSYRLMINIFGIMLIPLMYILAKKMFKNRKWALLSALIMMFDNFHFVHTRIALVDGFQVFFILLSVLFMWEYLELDKKESIKKKAKYLILSGTFIGCAIDTKWNASYIALGLAVVFFIHLFKNYKKKIFTFFKDKELLKLFFICILSFIIIPLVIYILSYILFPTVSYYDGTLKGIIDANKMMYDYHSGLNATHPFSSVWYEWPIMAKPVWLYSGATSTGLRMTITDIGNPAIWWFGIISFIYVIVDTIKNKNKTSMIIMIFALCGFIPYVFIGRLMFMYHYFIVLPFIMLGIVSFIKWITEKTKSDKAYYEYIVIIIIVFIIFYPVVAGLPVSDSYINSLKWLKEWFF